MWFWIIIIAIILGAAFAYFFGDGEKEDAISGGIAGGCMAGNCLVQLLIAAVSILAILWLFDLIFG